jgi:hypothetical protein
MMLLSVQCWADLFEQMHAQFKLSEFLYMYKLTLRRRLVCLKALFCKIMEISPESPGSWQQLACRQFLVQH